MDDQGYNHKQTDLECEHSLTMTLLCLNLQSLTLDLCFKTPRLIMWIPLGALRCWSSHSPSTSRIQWRWACSEVGFFSEWPSIPIHCNPLTRAVESNICQDLERIIWREKRHCIQVQPRGSPQGVKSILQAGSLHYRTSRTSTYKCLEALPVSNGILSSDVAVALTYEEQAGHKGNRL